MDYVNQTIREIHQAGILPTAVQTDLAGNLYRQGRDYTLGRYYQKIQFPPQFQIYYPVAYQNEFPPTPVMYQGGKISTQDLLQSIWSTYLTPLPQTSVQAYLKANPFVYQFLRTQPNPKLLDVMLDRIIVQGLEPYQDGYLLNLSTLE
jgi:hypothetical protein